MKRKLKMLFYRKKFLLAVLEAFGGSLDSLRFQKYLFLILEQLNKKHYNFVPYQYGCFSFESYNDKRNLINSGYLIEDNNNWTLKENKGFISEIKPEEKEQIFSVKREYGSLSKKALLNQIYSKYPYYAINSRVLQKADLNFKQKKEISNNRPKQNNLCLFTIGYEGRSIDEYLNLLIKNNIKILCDVRKNPVSRKYGFSKRSLKKRTKDLSMEYLHIPELGIISNLRKKLFLEQDYIELFAFYKRETLSKRDKELNKIIDELHKRKRVALTCFEAKSSLCHRHCISSTLKKISPDLNIKHL